MFDWAYEYENDDYVTKIYEEEYKLDVDIPGIEGFEFHPDYFASYTNTYNLQSRSAPQPAKVTFSFFFDEEKVNYWLGKEARVYQQIDKMYQQTWESYVNEVMPLFQQFGQISETYDAKFKDIDEQLNVQLESTFTDNG